MVTIEQLKQITGKDEKFLTPHLKSLNDTLTKYSINTPLRICHFLAQVLHESNNLVSTKEGLNYSADGLLATFGKYFPDRKTALLYEHKGDMIASRVYAKRMGNGDEKSQEGYKYCGRGFIQITGKSNYDALSKEFGVDFLASPALIATPEYAFLSAGWFWNTNGLNAFADKDNLLAITKKINGGVNGLDDRTDKLKKCKTIIK